MSEKYTYRKITEADLDMLYVSKDSDWLKDNFENRDNVISDYRGGYLEIMLSEDEKEILFFFPEDINKNEKGEWYIYFQKNKGIFVFQDRGSFHSLFYSSYCLENKEAIESRVRDLLIFSAKNNKLGLYPNHEIIEQTKDEFEFDFELNDMGRF